MILRDKMREMGFVLCYLGKFGLSFFLRNLYPKLFLWRLVDLYKTPPCT